MGKEVLFIMPRLTGGGAQKVLIDMLRNFDYNRYKVTLLMQFKDGVYLNDIPKEVEVLSIHGRYNRFFYYLFRTLGILHLFLLFHSIAYRFWCKYLLRGREYDAIISFMEGNALKFHSYICDKAKKNISWVHIDLKRKHWSADFFWNDKDELRCYQKMDNIIFVSEDARRNFLDLFNIVENRCIVIYNLIDYREISRLANVQMIDKRKFTICMVGRLNKQKRYDRALKVACQLKLDGYDFELWILGVGELEDILKERVIEYGLEKNVIFLGFVKNPYKYMRVADVYLSTSEAEGYPLVICEALSLGLPVVATDITGTREILGGMDSSFGLIVSEELDDIYHGLKLMMDSSMIREKYHKKALERRIVFRVSEVMNKIYSLIDESNNNNSRI